MIRESGWFETCFRDDLENPIGAVTALTAGLLPIDILGGRVSIGTLLALVVICAAVLLRRRNDPARPRPFRVPALPVVAGGSASCPASG